MTDLISSRVRCCARSTFHYFWYYSCVLLCVLFFFFFQAEDGIRDGTVTGVQTCALPISLPQNQQASVLVFSSRPSPGAGSASTRGSGAPLRFEAGRLAIGWDRQPGAAAIDRKSTRLNSSHSSISYAVFCLKKKKKQNMQKQPAESKNTTRKPILKPHKAKARAQHT